MSRTASPARKRRKQSSSEGCATLSEGNACGSTIKHDHSESLIAYYTRWLVAYSAPFRYLRLLLLITSRDIIFFVQRF